MSRIARRFPQATERAISRAERQIGALSVARMMLLGRRAELHDVGRAKRRRLAMDRASATRFVFFRPMADRAHLPDEAKSLSNTRTRCANIHRTLRRGSRKASLR